jgi:hypothetical protein
MTTMPGLRAFSLAAKGRGGVSFDADGVHVGHVPLLAASKASGANKRRVSRPIRDLNDELGALYRLPVDAARKASALQLIASALDRGDLAIATIATVRMQFPDPPRLAKGIETYEEIARRAAELARSGLLKFWDPAKHPRAGAPPNPGWFAPADADEPEAVTVLPAAMRTNRPGFSPFDFRPDIVEGGGGGGGNRGGAQSEFSFPRPWSRPTITEVPASRRIRRPGPAIQRRLSPTFHFPKHYRHSGCPNHRRKTMAKEYRPAAVVLEMRQPVRRMPG